MEERGLEKTKVLIRLRPFTWNERKRGAEKWPTAVTICPKAAQTKKHEAYDVLLGYEPAYSSHEPPSSVGRLLAARVASSMNLSASPENEEGPVPVMQTPPPPVDSEADPEEKFDPLFAGLNGKKASDDAVSRKVIEGTPEYWEDLLTPTTGGTSAVTPVNQKEVLRELGSNTPWSVGGGPDSAMKTPVKHTNLPSKFTFDHVYGPEVATHELYDTGGIGEIVNSMLDGYNGTIMCYGQTGSGKTYTMEGIVNLAIDDMFSFIEGAPGDEKFLLSASILEVYNEKVTDLLVSSTSTSETNLKLLDVPSKKGVAATTVVQGLSSVKVDSKDTLMNALQTAKLNRMTASTKINEKSSRSHLVIKLNLERIFQGSDQSIKGRMIQASCLNLVDLAGSERLQESQTSGLRMKESCAINQSLLCLGNVVSRLAEGSTGHIPYRDSKLTRLLQHALGGNSKTAMICTVSPAGGWHLEQTRSTLAFASRAMNISNKTMRNIEAERNHEMSSLLLKYEKEIEALNLQIREMESQGKENKEDHQEYVAHLQRKIDNLTKFILNDQQCPQTPSSVGRFDHEPVSKSASLKDPYQEHINARGRSKDHNRLYTTLGLVSPTVENDKDSMSYDNKNFLVSPLMEQLEKYKDQRKRHQSDLSASIEETKKCHDTILRLQEDVASLKEERERDQTLLRQQMQEIQHELDDYEKENIKLQTKSEKFQAVIAQREAMIKHTQDDVIRLEASTASKDALLDKHSKIIHEMKQEMSDLLHNKQNQAKEIKNLKALNQRLCREAEQARESKEQNRKGLEDKLSEKQEVINSLRAEIQGLERHQQESDVEARRAEESALELCSQISALEGTLEKVGTKAAMVSPANRRVKELEEILSIKNAQLRDVEEKIDSMNLKPMAQNENKMGKKKFDAQKLRRFALRLDTALIKIENCTISAETSPVNQPGLSSRSDNSPVLPDRPIDAACITWQDYRTFSGNKENQSPRTPENMQIDKSMFQASAVKRHELRTCICDAINFSKLFKNEIELLYQSLQEAEEANDGQQVLLTVVAQEHAKKTSDLENEIARLKSGLKDSALEDQASRGSIHALKMSIAEYEEANLELNAQMKQCKQQVQSCSVILQSKSDELKEHKSLVKEKENIISQKDFIIAELKISEDEKATRLQTAFSELKTYKSALEQKSAEIDNLNNDIAEKITLLAQRESRLLEFGEQQGNEKNIIAQLKGDQKDLLKTVGQLKLDLHKRDELLQARTEELASVELKLESLKGELQTLSSTNEMALSSKSADVEKLRALNVDLMKQLRSKEMQNTEKESQLKQEVDGNAKLAQTVENLTRARDTLDSQNLAQKEQLAAVEREIKDQVKLLKEKDSLIFQCQEQISELRMEFDNSTEHAAGIKEELAFLEVQFDTKIEECTSLQRALEEEKAKVNHFSDDLRGVQGKLQAESQALAFERDRRVELESELSKKRDTIAQKHQESTRLIKECDILKETCKNTDEKLENMTLKFEDCQSDLFSTQRILENLESLSRSIQEEKDGLEGSLRTKDEMASELRNMIDEKNEEVEMIQSNVEVLENKILEMTNLSEQYSSHMVTQNKCLEENYKQLQELQDQVTTAQDALASKDDQIAHLELELEGKVLEHGHYEALLERIEIYEEELEEKKAIQQEMEEEIQRYKSRLDAFHEVDEINLNFGHVQSTTNILGVLDFSDEEHSPQMLRIMKLWKELCVPLYHRSRFYGTKSNSLIRNNVAILALELNRLQWIKESMSAGSNYLPRAKADLSRERNELMIALRRMPKSVRDAMFTAWGYSRDDRKRKQRIISSLWDKEAAPSKSSTIVLLLNEGCLDRKTCFLHFCSLYAMHHFSETDLQEGQESPIPVIPISYDSEEEDEEEHESPVNRKKSQTALSKVFTPLLKLTGRAGGSRKRDE